MEEIISTRKDQTCRRCFCREYIPTYQFVKFDNQLHYLCQRCWEDFRKWFHWGRRPSNARGKAEV